MQEARPLYEESLRLREVVHGNRSIKVRSHPAPSPFSFRHTPLLLHPPPRRFLCVRCTAGVCVSACLRVCVSAATATAWKVAESKQNLATVLDAQGYLQEAEALLLEALKVRV